MTPRIRMLGLAALCLALIAAGGQKINIEIFVVPTDHSSITDATIYLADGQSADIVGPHPHARFTLPASTQTIGVIVDAPGFCTLSTTLQVGGKSHVGGWGYWLYVSPGTGPCTAVQPSATR